MAHGVYLLLAHLTCAQWQHYLEKFKKSYFNNVIYTCFRIFRLPLNKTDYNCHNAAVRALALQQGFEVTFICTNTIRPTESVKSLLVDRLTDNA